MKSRATANPPNRFHDQIVAYEDGEAPPPSQVTVIDDHARSILSHNDSPDLGFRWSANPYRGCQHACAYCYARPTHEYLDLGAGTDFDTKIVVKRDAAALLREAFDKPSWQGELILHRIRQTRGGDKLYDARFGTRGRGEGVYAEMIQTMFDATVRRLGLDHRNREGSMFSEAEAPTTFCRPARPSSQLSLF